MCNSWEYFFTGTLNPEWHDRHNLDRFRSAFAQWIRDQRKKYRSNIRYVFVAERHKDGAWHLHGLLSGIPQDRLSRFVPGIHPRRLVDGDYLNWGDYAKKFGFVRWALFMMRSAVRFIWRSTSRRMWNALYRIYPLILILALVGFAVLCLLVKSMVIGQSFLNI